MSSEPAEQDKPIAQVNGAAPDAEADPDVRLMRLALEQAMLAQVRGETPVGAIVWRDGVVLAAAGNRREQDQDPTAHAEILALREAARVLGSWRLEGCTLVVTLEPCPMCAGALVNARVPRLVYGATDPKAGAVDTLHHLCTDPRLNHRMEVRGGILAGECGSLLTNFFRLRRGADKPPKRGA